MPQETVKNGAPTPESRPAASAPSASSAPQDFLPPTSAASVWLAYDEQVAWRTFLFTTTRVRDALSQVLEQDPKIDLSLAEYEILVRLSEGESHSVRMSDLASHVVHSRSRLTHTVARMEKRGLVSRERCAEDGRGRIARLTSEGYELLMYAAPIHVQSVRDHLYEQLGREDFLELGRILSKLLTAEDREAVDPPSGR